MNYIRWHRWCGARIARESTLVLVNRFCENRIVFIYKCNYNYFLWCLTLMTVLIIKSLSWTVISVSVYSFSPQRLVVYVEYSVNFARIAVASRCVVFNIVIKMLTGQYNDSNNGVYITIDIIVLLQHAYIK